MATGQLIEMKDEGREAFADVLRFYELAKRREWQVRDLPWGDLPPIPEAKGSPQSQARRRDMWRSVLTQQLQADMLACDMASQLLNMARMSRRSSTTRRWSRTSRVTPRPGSSW